MFKMIFRMFGFGFRYYSTGIVLLLPLLCAVSVWDKINTHENDGKKKDVAYKYFEHKQWYPGNEAFICRSNAECARYRLAAARGYDEGPGGDVSKCRGKWYWRDNPDDDELYRQCLESIIHLDFRRLCSVQEPFCVDFNEEPMWNTPYNKAFPKRLVDPNKYTPRMSLLPEEEEYMKQINFYKRDVIWKGYVNVTPQTIWIERGVGLGRKLK